MNTKLRILILSSEVWQDGTNGGNVLTNIFQGFDAEFAQIYCSPGVPQNEICTKYYQMTDSMVINNLLKRTQIGKGFSITETITNNNNAGIQQENKKFYSFFRRYRSSVFYAIQELMWKLSNWNNESLKRFILDFNPDIIFAPCYANHRMLRLTRYCAELTGKPVISYISDDNYSFKQFRISPIYWINRIVLRHNMKITFPYYSLVYTMTQEQKNECENLFNANMKILTKAEDAIDYSTNVNVPIKMIFAGGIYCGRWKTLSAISKVINEINVSKKNIELHIYTGNELTKKQRKLLDNGYDSFVHKSVGQKELKDRYYNSDIALHIEGFDLKNRLLTRVSFSTKITDCLSSGCAVMAIAWKEHSGLKYLKKEDAAICIERKQDIKKILLEIVNNSEILNEYKAKAKKCLEKNHNKEHMKEMLINDFKQLAEYEL